MRMQREGSRENHLCFKQFVREELKRQQNSVKYLMVTRQVQECLTYHEKLYVTYQGRDQNFKFLLCFVYMEC